MSPTYRIQLMGGEVRIYATAAPDEPAITRFRTRKTAELLAYLACYRERPHAREFLVDLLWPDADLDSGRHNLSMALSALRQQLEPTGVPDGAVLFADRHTVALNPGAVTTDVAEFETLVTAARTAETADRIGLLSAAVERYTGELLTGYFGHWIGAEQQRLEELFCRTLAEVLKLLGERSQTGRGIELALHALRAQPRREEIHRELIRLYAAAGRPDAAWEQFRELERMLKEELDTAPTAETRAVLHGIPEPRLAARPHQDAGREPAVCGHKGGAVGCEPSSINPCELEPVGGGVPLHSRFYITRPADRELQEAIARLDSIVLVKGARQVGKTSLLARGLQHARERGARVILTHFQVFNSEHLSSTDRFLRTMAHVIAAQLDLEPPGDSWDPALGPSLNLRQFLRRQVLGRIDGPLVWGLDEVDRLFSCAFAGEVFGLFRSWHDERALDPAGPWSRLTLAIAYSTEAHLFITDLHQSPFNVGTRLALEDFTVEQVEDLNQRYGSPLRGEAELARFYRLLNGHPYLVRLGLHQMAAHAIHVAKVEARATHDDWIFGEHLRRIGVLLAQDPVMGEAVRVVLEGKGRISRDSFYRLRSAGLLAGASPEDARLRCQLYSRYLSPRLA